MKCHIIVDKGDRKFVDWNEDIDKPDQFKLTLFSHAQHLVDECQTCHMTDVQLGFKSMPIETCSKCHMGNKATDNCLTCHIYHNKDKKDLILKSSLN